MHPRFASRHRRDKIACPRLSAPTCFAEQESSPLTRRCAAGVDVTKPKTLAQASLLAPSLQTPSSRNPPSDSDATWMPGLQTPPSRNPRSFPYSHHGTTPAARPSHLSRCPPPPLSTKGGLPRRRCKGHRCKCSIANRVRILIVPAIFDSTDRRPLRLRRLPTLGSNPAPALAPGRRWRGRGRSSWRRGPSSHLLRCVCVCARAHARVRAFVCFCVSVVCV